MFPFAEARPCSLRTGMHATLIRATCSDECVSESVTVFAAVFLISGIEQHCEKNYLHSIDLLAWQILNVNSLIIVPSLQ